MAGCLVSIDAETCSPVPKLSTRPLRCPSGSLSLHLSPFIRKNIERNRNADGHLRFVASREQKGRGGKGVDKGRKGMETCITADNFAWKHQWHPVIELHRAECSSNHGRSSESFFGTRESDKKEGAGVASPRFETCTQRIDGKIVSNCFEINFLVSGKSLDEK